MHYVFTEISANEHVLEHGFYDWMSFALSPFRLSGLLSAFQLVGQWMVIIVLVASKKLKSVSKSIIIQHSLNHEPFLMLVELKSYVFAVSTSYRHVI